MDQSNSQEPRQENFNMPLVVDHAFRPSDACDQSTFGSPPAKATTKGTISFLDLPPEVRAMIYRPLIQAGHISILCVSKLVNHEAIPLLSSVATLRANVGYLVSSEVTVPLTANITFSGLLTFAAPNYIQNLDLRIDLVPRVRFSINAGLIQCFGGSQVARRSCQITITLGVSGFLLPTPEEGKTYDAIADLTGFKTLTLKLEFHKDISTEDPALRRSDTIPFITQAKVLNAYDYLTWYFAKTLGPAKFEYSSNGRYLSFQPNAYNSLNVDS